jgi:cytolethal distending toxin subunit B
VLRIATWNMFGGRDGVESKWTKGVTQLLKREADVVCLQECGALPGSVQQPPNIPPWNVNVNLAWAYVTWTPFRPRFNVLWVQTDPNGNRVNLALCSPRPPARLLFAPGVQLTNGGVGRPAIGFEIQGLCVFTVHALSSATGTGGQDAGQLMANIDAAVNGFPGNGPWCAAGDFNRGPTTWNPPAGVPLPPKAITRPASAAMLDYCVLFPPPAPPFPPGYVDNTFELSDHYPVFYDIG